MKLKVFLDLDSFDKKVLQMSEEDKKQWVWRLNSLCRIADKLYEKGEISKTIRNRIGQLWSFSPYQNVQMMPSKKFNELMGLKNPNLKFISNAVKKVLELNGSDNEVSQNK